MKTNYILYIFLMGILLGVNSPINAQSRRLSYSQNLESFAGTWEYSNNGEVFRVVLVRGTLNVSYAYGDYLLGGYYYSKNGVVQYDCEQHIPTEYTDASDDFYTGPAISGTNGSIYSQQIAKPNMAYLSINDYVYDKWGRVFFTLRSPTKAHFKLVEVWGKDPDWPDGFSIPTDVVLTKVVVPPPPPDPPTPPGPPELGEPGQQTY